MGKQLTFFLLPEDLKVVEDAIVSTGPVVFLPDVAAEPKAKPLESIGLPIELMGKERLRVYVTSPEFLPRVGFRYVPEQDYYVVEPGSPVIELDRSYFDGRKLLTGRMYLYTGPGFDLAFIKWADKVLRAVRKALRRSQESRTEYFGPAAQEWMKRTKAKVHPGMAVYANSV